MTQMPHKGYGRIYCEKSEDIDKIKAIIEQMDSFEFDYLPDDFITTFDKFPQVVYTGKFDDLDMDDLTVICWQRGIKIFAFNAGHNEFPPKYSKEYTARHKQ